MLPRSGPGAACQAAGPCCLALEGTAKRLHGRLIPAASARPRHPVGCGGARGQRRHTSKRTRSGTNAVRRAGNPVVGNGHAALCPCFRPRPPSSAPDGALLGQKFGFGSPGRQDTRLPATHSPSANGSVSPGTWVACPVPGRGRACCVLAVTRWGPLQRGSGAEYPRGLSCPPGHLPDENVPCAYTILFGIAQSFVFVSVLLSGIGES